MVSELESLMGASSKSPEAQWRLRILIRSTQEADRDIWKRLHQYETSSYGSLEKDIKAHSSAGRKLHRDYQRVHNQLHAALERYQKQQEADVACLSSSYRGPEEKKEDFFDRAMREREQEIHHIHQSMNTVNQIYTVRFAKRKQLWMPLRTC